MSVGIVTDSVACLPAHVTREPGLRVVPVHVVVDGIDHMDGDLDEADLHHLIADGADVSTASPSAGEFVTALESLAATGCEAALVVTVSSRLSAVYSAASIAARAASIRTAVVDSATVASAQGLIVRRLAVEAASGTTLEGLIDLVPAIRASVGLRAVVPDLEGVSRTGRVPKVVARVGDRLDVKPLIEIDADGEARLAAMARSMTAGIRRLVAHAVARAGPGAPHLVVMHALAADRAREIRDELGAAVPLATVEVAPFTAVMSIHTGPGLVGIAWERDPTERS